MKKIVFILLAAVLIFSLAACADKNNTLGSTNQSDSSMTITMPNLTTEPSKNDTTASDATSKDRNNSSTEKSEPAENSTEIEVPDSAVQGQSIITGEPGGSTPTGFFPLERISYTVIDPDNQRGLSTKKICHSHGPASGGKPHFTVVEFQDTFDKFGALTLDRKSTGKVLYLTFDCGWEYENLTSKVLDTLKEKDVPAAFFCTLDHIKKQPDLIGRMIKEGHIVGNHSDTHPSFPEISRNQMAKEIENTENYLRENFGYCAKYFRFPAGEYSESALDLVQSLGYTSVFWSVAYNDWNVENIQGRDVALKTVTERLHDGAVILLHAVSKDNAEALGDIIDKAREQGYEFKSLEYYRK